MDAEINDEVYEVYTDLLSQREDDDDTLCYKTYTLVYLLNFISFKVLKVFFGVLFLLKKRKRRRNNFRDHVLKAV
jgi:hypothetical protein